MEPSAVQHENEAGRMWRQNPKGACHCVHLNKETLRDIIETDLVFGKKTSFNDEICNE